MDSEHDAIHSAPPSPAPEVSAVPVPEQNADLEPFSQATCDRKWRVVCAWCLASVIVLVIIVVLLIFYTKAEYTNQVVGLAVSLGIFVGLELPLVIFTCIKAFQYDKYLKRRPSQTIDEILPSSDENPLDPTSQESPALHSRVEYFRKTKTNTTNSQSSDDDSVRVISVDSANKGLEVHAPNDTPSVSGPSSESGSVNTGTTSAETESSI